MLNGIACPHCGEQELAAQEPTGVVVCTRCGLKYASDDPIACPKCEAINSKTAAYCSACGEALKQKCQNCGVENWAGAYTCLSCQQSLNSVEAIALRHAQGYRGTLEEQRRGASALKAQEAAASRKRMAGLMDVENKRQAQLAQQMAEQKAQQTRLLLAAAIVLVIFVVAAVFFVVATAR